MKKPAKYLMTTLLTLSVLIGGTRYLCTVYCKGSNDKLNADSPEKLIKLLEKYSYIK